MTCIEPERIRPLNSRKTAAGRYVLYWMQASQRVSHNPALEHAIARANELRLPLVVGFGLMDDYPEANLRHYAFMVDGLRDVRRDLAARGIQLIVRRGPPPDVALELGAAAALIVCDTGYLRHQRAWRRRVGSAAPQRVEGVEGDVVVPIALVSDHAEFAARTLRPKLLRLWERFLAPLKPTDLERPSIRLRLPLSSDLDVRHPARVLAALRLDASVGPVRRLRGGSSEAHSHLQEFLDERLAGYAEARGAPDQPAPSLLSPYLHFGQVSPVAVALAVREAGVANGADRRALLEQLVVRRELAVNFVRYQPVYDRYAGVPEWARKSLHEHARDPREHIYSRAQLVAAKTHDRHFNAAMLEMVHTGYMNNSLRMYWGKKILEWSSSPESAFRTALWLNNRYFLDGRDPNSYAGVSWCFGAHDRPWQERPIFGKVRFMNDRGLERKFDMHDYQARVDALVRAERQDISDGR